MYENKVKLEMDRDQNVCPITPLPGSRATPWMYLFSPHYTRVALKIIILRMCQKFAWVRRRICGSGEDEWKHALSDIFDEKEILVVASIKRFNRMQERFKIEIT